MAKKHTFLLFVLIGLTLIIMALANSFPKNPMHSQACFGERCFNLEIAKTNRERSHGLMFRENLPENSGLLFIFQEEKKHSFWMKNTLIPLDIIWLDKNQKVVFIKNNAIPCPTGEECRNIKPDKEAMYVLEINAGLAEEINLKLGDKLGLK